MKLNILKVYGKIVGKSIEKTIEKLGVILRRFFTSCGQFIKKFIEKSKVILRGIFTPCGRFIKKAIEKLGVILRGIFTPCGRFIKKAIKKLGIILRRIFSPCGKFVKKIIEKLKAILCRIFTPCGKIVKKPIEKSKVTLHRIFTPRRMEKKPEMRKNRWDLFLFITAIVVLAGLFIGRLSMKPVVPEGHTDLLVSSRFADLFGKDTANALIQEFMKQKPHLWIRMVEQADEAGVDIIIFEDGEYGSLISESALLSIDPYLDNEKQTQWGLPLVSFVDLFFYNIDILTAANRINPPKTRAEFLDTAKAVAGLGGFFPLALGLGPEESGSNNAALRRDIYPWMWADGPITTEKGELSRTAVNTIAFIDQLNREGLLAPGTFEITGKQRLNEFAEGRIAMMPASARNIPFLQQRRLNFNVTAMPSTTVGKNRLGLTGIHAGISGSSAVPDESWDFLAFLARKSQVLAQALGAVPGSPGVFPDEYTPGEYIKGEYIKEDSLLSKAWEIFEAADIVEYQAEEYPEEERINEHINEAERVISERLIEALQ